MRYIMLLLLLLEPQGYTQAARCEGTPNNLDVRSQFCQAWVTETSCSYDAWCLWETDNGCNMKSSPSCLSLAEEDCNSIDGCYWAEIPVWVWLAINIPVWVVVALVCLVCYYKHVDPPTRLGGSYTLSDSITINSSSQYTERETIPDRFGIPPPVASLSECTESEMGSSDSGTAPLEEVGAMVEDDVRIDI